MRRPGGAPGVRMVLLYAGAGLAVVAVGAMLLGNLMGPGGRPAVWLGAAIAYGVQVVVFAVLVWSRGGRGFVGAWVGGTLTRFAAVLFAALWLARDPAYPAGPLLLSLVAFLFILLMLEAMFFRMGMRGR